MACTVSPRLFHHDLFVCITSTVPIRQCSNNKRTPLKASQRSADHSKLFSLFAETLLTRLRQVGSQSKPIAKRLQRRDEGGKRRLLVEITIFFIEFQQSLQASWIKIENDEFRLMEDEQRMKERERERPKGGGLTRIQ